MLFDYATRSDFGAGVESERAVFDLIGALWGLAHIPYHNHCKLQPTLAWLL